MLIGVHAGRSKLVRRSDGPEWQFDWGWEGRLVQGRVELL